MKQNGTMVQFWWRTYLCEPSVTKLVNRDMEENIDRTYQCMKAVDTNIRA